MFFKRLRAPVRPAESMGCQIYRLMIYLYMLDEPMRRLLDYDHRRYWLVNGWSVRFRIAEVEVSVARPHGIKYSFTLHDLDGTRLLGYDNAHGVPRAQEYDHRHRFRHAGELVAYEFRGADELLVDFFAAVERACTEEGSAFEFEAEEIELEAEEDDNAQVHD
jgi:Family of unknown function (DUF6516)